MKEKRIAQSVVIKAKQVSVETQGKGADKAEGITVPPRAHHSHARTLFWHTKPREGDEMVMGRGGVRAYPSSSARA
jgi:hypothetical protein